MSTWGALAGMWALIAVSGLPARADPARQRALGQHLSQECTTCHRIDGADNGIPSIIGWDADAFRSTVQFYKDGLRSNQAMESVAKSLDGEQIEALAAYFGSLPKPQRTSRKR